MSGVSEWKLVKRSNAPAQSFHTVDETFARGWLTMQYSVLTFPRATPLPPEKKVQFSM